MIFTNPKDESILALHRYYVWAGEMRACFDALLNAEIEREANEPLYKKKTHPAEIVRENTYMSYWYAGLYVVSEGWKELKLSDANIDALLASSNLLLLKRYRNGVFHYQRKYHDARFLDLITDGERVVEWSRALHSEYGRYFLDWFRTKGLNTETLEFEKVVKK